MFFIKMRLVTLYRIIATVCVLLAETGVRGDHNDDYKPRVPTRAVTTAAAQTRITTPVLAEAIPLAIPNTSPSAPQLLPRVVPHVAPPSQLNRRESNNSSSTMQAAQMEAPSADQAPNRPPALAAAQGPGLEIVIDPATGDLLGGNPPSKNVDLPITIVFLMLFLLGAFTHISIYRANAKRGHKFLLSDLMFDFCMIRSVTCIFRITWIFRQLRGVVLAAQIFFNGG
jgi:hypothetical protein